MLRFDLAMISSLQCVLAEHKCDNLDITAPKLINPAVVARVRPTRLCFSGSAKMKNKKGSSVLYLLVAMEICYTCAILFFENFQSTHSKRKKFNVDFATVLQF